MDEDAEAGNWMNDDFGNKFWWKLCTTRFCQHFVCRGYSEDHCYNHMPIDARVRKDADMAET